jgi:hypothetical protein
MLQEWTRKELTSHFQKLLGYDICRLFVHLTYSYVDSPGDVLEELKRAAEGEAPAGFEFVRREDILSNDSRPSGFVASYRTALREVKVIFLVLDFAQTAQRRAARIAGETNPRRPADRKNDRRRGRRSRRSRRTAR